MGFVNGKCPNCGANIKVNNDMKTGICEFCGAPFISEKAINNYYVSNNYSIQNSQVTITQDVLPVNMKQITISRPNSSTELSTIVFDVCVDGVVCATIKNEETIKIEIDENRQHRIYCVANCSFGQTIKSNVVFFDVGKTQHILINVFPGKKIGEFHTITLTCLESETLINNKVELIKEETRKKKTKKRITIVAIITTIILLIIAIPMCSEADLKKYQSSYYDYALGVDNTYIVVGYNITNNSSSDRKYQIAVDIIRKSDNAIIAKGTSIAFIKIKSNATKEITVACYHTDLGKQLGYDKIYEEDICNLSSKITAISIDGNIYYK